jgi:hypothetical protein
MMAERRDIGFLFVGGMHQAMHIAPLAAALAARDVAVTAYVNDAADADALAALLARLDSRPVAIEVLALPRWLRSPLRRHGGKELRLLLARRRLLRHDALVAAERTSTILKRLPGRKPGMIHIPHGAGDRAKGFERRIGLFDHVITAGEKDRRRMIERGLVPPEHCTASGSLKVAAILRTVPAPPRPFGDARPIILYNPHFDRRLSSWTHFAWTLTERIVADGRYNLIVAPHVRLFAALAPAERARWLDRAPADNLLIDFGSARSIDMGHVRVADIYLGDVSSQIYEYLVEPRPAVFIDAHDADWLDNPDYLMWRFGAVCRSADEIMASLAGAAARHRDYRDAQIRDVRDALGPIEGSPERAAQQLLAVLDRAPSHIRPATKYSPQRDAG